MINDVTLDLSHATIEAEALEFDEAAAMERLPHAELGGIDGVGGPGGGAGGGGAGLGNPIGGMGMNGNGAVSEHISILSFVARTLMLMVTPF